MKELQTKYSSCKSSEMSSKYLTHICPFLDDFIDKISEMLNVDSKDFHFELEIYDDRESYRTAANISKDNYKDWMVGECKNGKVKLLVPNAANRSVESMDLVVKHEIVHAVCQHNKFWAGNMVIDEGVAIFLSGQNSERILTPEFPKISEISHYADFAKNGGYTFAGIYIEYLFSKIGVNKIKEIFTKKAKLEDFIHVGFEQESINWFNKINREGLKDNSNKDIPLQKS